MAGLRQVDGITAGRVGARARLLGLTLGLACLIALIGLASPAFAHELEKTQVVVTFAADGQFTIDVLNEPNWLWAQLAPVPTNLPPSAVRDHQLSLWTDRFARSITLVFDDRRVQAERVEYFPPLSDDPSAIGGLEPGLMRVTGTAPVGSAVFRLAYALVVDPFPLTTRSAGGTSATTWVTAGESSNPIVLAGRRPIGPWQALRHYLAPGLIAVAFVALAALRLKDWHQRHARASIAYRV